MSKNKQTAAPAPRAAAPEPAPAPDARAPARGPVHEFNMIGGTTGKNQIYKCQKCGYQTMSTVENPSPNPFTPHCFVAPLAGPVTTP